MHLYKQSGLGNTDPTQIRNYLYELSDGGLVFVRMETEEERQVRGGGNSAFGPLAAFFSTTSPVPQRTVTEAIPGVVLVNAATRRKRSDAGVPKGPRKARRKHGSQVAALVRKTNRAVAREERLAAAHAEMPVRVVLTPEEKLTAAKQRHPAARVAEVPAARPVDAARGDLTSSLDALVEQLVADRTSGLAARLAEAEARANLAEARLLQLKSLLS